jgi:hypothetical protein
MSQIIVATVLASAVLIFTVLSGLVLAEQEPTKTVAQANFAVAVFSLVVVVVLCVVIWTAESNRLARRTPQLAEVPS